MHRTWVWDGYYVFVNISYNFKHLWPINVNFVQFLIVCLGGGITSCSVISLPVLQIFADLHSFLAL